MRDSFWVFMLHRGLLIETSEKSDTADDTDADVAMGAVKRDSGGSGSGGGIALSGKLYRCAPRD